MLDVCWKFAKCLLDRVNTLLGYTAGFCCAYNRTTMSYTKMFRTSCVSSTYFMFDED